MSSPESAKKEDPGAKPDQVAPAGGSAPNESQQSKEPEVESFPDPDEDDLDDLDDMLDEFSAVKVDTNEAHTPAEAARPAPKPEAAAPTTTSGPAPAAVEDEFSDEDFAKQLQEGMADLLGQLEQSPDMQSQFEEMFNQMNAVVPESDGQKGASSSSKGSEPKASATDASFQDTIRRTMERMQNSGDQATNAAAASGSEDDFMAEMLKQLGSGEGNEEDFSKMLMGMMEQLTNKEILYEPMKELNEKFPEWMEKNKSSTPADDLKRYEEQQTLVSEIVAKFESSTYTDSNSADREYIVDRMQKMQAAGSPPSDLVGSMPSAQEAFNMPDDQCNPQ